MDLKSLVSLIYKSMQQIFPRFTGLTNRNSVVGMDTGLVTGWSRDRGSFLGSGTIFFPTQSARTSFLFQLEMGGGGCLPQGYSGRGVNLTTHHHLSTITRVAGLTTHALIPPLLGVYRNSFDCTGYTSLVNFWDLRKLVSLLPLPNKKKFKVSLIR